ncbi:O-antigen ligase family protein [Allokutzneria albata]|uniref:O-antigen ligase n=1 Tax=Allokutzneria albata TaxID=211114 RepID=A0A1H0CFE3_ALLAB|nr:O-antigen ligase family protein [Allokutzneria albata]SDN56597.1 O-antigen ligase [Allokutzneria albata]
MIAGATERLVAIHDVAKAKTSVRRRTAREFFATVPAHYVLVVFAALLALPQNVVIAGVGGSLTPARLVAAICLIWWVVARAAGGMGMRIEVNPVRATVLAGSLVLLAAHALALGLGTPAELLGGAGRGWMLYALCVGVALLACDGLAGLGALRAVLGAVVLGVTASAFAAVVHFAVKTDLRALISLPGMEVQGLGKIDLARGGLERALGFANHPIELAALSSSAIPLALYLTRFARKRLLWWGCVLVLVAGIVVSISRTGLLGLAMIGLFLLPRLGILRWALGAVVAGVFATLAMTAEPKLFAVISQTVVGSSNDYSVWSRLADYDYVISRLEQRPWSGQGLGTYTAPPQPFLDNQYLLTLVESGIPGLLVLVALLLVPVFSARAAWIRLGRLGNSSELRDAAWAVGSALAVAAMCFATFDALAFPQFQGMTFLLIGVGGAIASWERAETSS